MAQVYMEAPLLLVYYKTNPVLYKADNFGILNGFKVSIKHGNL